VIELGRGINVRLDWTVGASCAIAVIMGVIKARVIASAISTGTRNFFFICISLLSCAAQKFPLGFFLRITMPLEKRTSRNASVHETL
jgi:hypothetical protein